MGQRLLIAGGCSYTDENFRTTASDFDMPEKTWPMWPEHLAKKLNLKHVNVARCGYDNFTIFEKVLKEISLNEGKIEAVTVLWSGWDRSLLFNIFPIVTMHSFYHNLIDEGKWTQPTWMIESGFIETIKSYLNSDWWDPPSFIRESVKNTLSLMYALATICESKNIKYLFYQGVQPMATGYINQIENIIKRPNEKKYEMYDIDVFNYIKKCSFSGKLEERKKKIIGWPFIEDASGNYLDSIRYDEKVFPTGPMSISEMDKHPNADVQPIIADIFHNQWKKVYG